MKKFQKTKEKKISKNKREKNIKDKILYGWNSKKERKNLNWCGKKERWEKKKGNKRKRHPVTWT